MPSSPRSPKASGFDDSEPAGPSGPLTSVRSTLVASSLEVLRRGGHERAYAASLAPEVRATLLAVVPGRWLALDVALAHYRACDALGLGEAVAEANGYAVGQRVEAAYRKLWPLARSLGADPWTVLRALPSLLALLWRGGSVEVAPLGPKDARVVFGDNRLMEVPYFRAGLRGLARGGFELFCQRVYVTELPMPVPAIRSGVRIAWA